MGAEREEEREGEEKVGKAEVVEKQREMRRREGSRASERQTCRVAERQSFRAAEADEM